MPANALSYTTSADCGIVTITVTELAATTGLEVALHGVLTPDEPQQNQLVVDGTTATITFLTDKDTVFSFALKDEDGNELVSEPLFIACRGNKCFAKINNEEAEAIMAGDARHSDEWKLIGAFLRSATAAFRKNNLVLSANLLATLEDICKSFNCHCGC